MGVSTTPRPVRHLLAAGKLYPKAWKLAAWFREEKGGDLPNWPGWCYLPLAGWYAVLSAALGVERLSLQAIGDISKLAALGAWRFTQGIYRFHPATLEALSKTSLHGNLPSEVFTRLPEWCIYVEASRPGCHGFFVHLEHDAEDGRMELRLLLDTEDMLAPLILHLGDWTIQEAIDRTAAVAKRQARTAGIDEELLTPPAHLADTLQPMLALVLYVCSTKPEYQGGVQPQRPKPKRIKKGWRLFPASHPRVWHLGHDTGEAIVKARDRRLSGDRSRPEPHIRRAHWHGYWMGPKDGARRFEVRWLPPIPVNADLLGETAPGEYNLRAVFPAKGDTCKK